MTNFKGVIWGIILPALIGALSAISVGGLNYFNKDKELDIQLVNVGLSIMRGEATGERDTLQARRFALRLLNTYAKVDIPPDEFEAWASKGATPFAVWPNFYGIIDNIDKIQTSTSDLLTGIEYAYGIQLGALGCLKTKDHVENPGQTPLADAEANAKSELERSRLAPLCKAMIDKQRKEIQGLLDRLSEERFK